MARLSNGSIDKGFHLKLGPARPAIRNRGVDETNQLGSVRVGRSDDPGRTPDQLPRDDEIFHEDKHGGLFGTRPMIEPEFQPGIARHPHRVMRAVAVGYCPSPPFFTHFSYSALVSALGG